MPTVPNSSKPTPAEQRVIQTWRWCRGSIAHTAAKMDVTPQRVHAVLVRHGLVEPARRIDWSRVQGLMTREAGDLAVALGCTRAAVYAARTRRRAA